MKRSTAKRIEKRINNLPLYFVDSSVFLEVLLKQTKYGECMSFFSRSRYKYRLITSTLVLGEILRGLNKIEYQQTKRTSLLLLADLFETTEIKTLAMSFECISNTNAIRNIESYLLPSDCLIFSSAITENSDAFITLDNDFSLALANGFNVKIKRPNDV